MLYPNQIMLEPQAVPMINLVMPISLIRQAVIGYLRSENYAAVDAIIGLIHSLGYQPEDLGIPIALIGNPPCVVKP